MTVQESVNVLGNFMYSRCDFGENNRLQDCCGYTRNYRVSTSERRCKGGAKGVRRWSAKSGGRRRTDRPMVGDRSHDNRFVLTCVRHRTTDHCGERRWRANVESECGERGREQRAKVASEGGERMQGRNKPSVVN
jgi:hypothetical protein